MASYWDYVKDAMANYTNFNGLLQSWYDRAYDNSHGSQRYWLTKVPWLSTWRKYKDEAQQAQDRYDNTGIDEAYIQNVVGFSGASASGDLSSFGNRAGRMARSLSECYPIEVLENLGIDDKLLMRGVA